MKTKYTLLCLLLFISSSLYSQKITGLWLVKKVTVGEEVMTPQAKWFAIHKDKTYTAGNGWIQNDEGTWTYDKKKKLYQPTKKLGLKDLFGAFKVSFSGEQMIWEREEEGMKVIVTLESIANKPKGTAAALVGMWEVVTAQKDGKNVIESYNENKNTNFFFRWDRIYLHWDKDGKRQTGYWHINGHAPKITLLPHTKGQEPQNWQVEVTDQELKLIGISDSNKGLVLSLKRKDHFPN